MTCSLAFPALGTGWLHVIASNSDRFVVLFAPVMIGHSICFTTGFTTLIGNWSNAKHSLLKRFSIECNECRTLKSLLGSFFNSRSDWFAKLASLF